MEESNIESSLYVGKLFHRRHTPKDHSFEYEVFMVFVNLDEINHFLARSPLWSMRPWFPACFKRSDFHGNPERPLVDEVKSTVKHHLNLMPNGKVFMLANFRYFGINMNPLITYYCFDECDKLIAILAEVNNTPWNERHAYVLDCRNQKKYMRFDFAKEFTVSPFNPINMRYDWCSSEPKNKLSISINTHLENQKVLTAVLRLTKISATSRAMNWILIKYPMHTLKVVVGIYWQALKLYIKGIPFLGKNKEKDISYLEH